MPKPNPTHPPPLREPSEEEIQLTVDLSLSAVHCCMRSPMFTNTVPAKGLAAVYSPLTGRTCNVKYLLVCQSRNYWYPIWHQFNSMHMLQTHAPVMFLVVIFILMHFRPFSTIHTYKICMHFHFEPLSRVFSNLWVFNENTQGAIISVDRRIKRINA